VNPFEANNSAFDPDELCKLEARQSFSPKLGELHNGREGAGVYSAAARSAQHLPTTTDL